VIKGFWWRFWWLLALAITVLVSTAVYVVTEVCK
jgi:hypothetical protein